MEAVAKLGATPCTSEAELVEERDVIFMSVSSEEGCWLLFFRTLSDDY